MVKNFSKYLSKNGLPVFWQWYVLLDSILSASTPFIQSSLIYHTVNIFVLFLTIIGFSHLITQKNRSLLLWGPLFYGVIIIKVAFLMPEAKILGIDIEPEISFWTEQVGILLISIFAFSIMFLLEKKFRLSGLTVDFTLFVLALSIFVLLTTPDLLNIFLDQLNLEQQLLIIKLVLSLIMLLMTLLLNFFTKKFIFNNIILSITTLLIMVHFSIDLVSSLNNTDIPNIYKKISRSSYHFAGVTTLVFAFIEHISKSYYSKNAYKVSSSLMWIASITAIFTIPTSILIRWYQHQEQINSGIFGIFSFFLSSIVIWRFILLIQNTQRQGKNLKKIAYTDSVTYLPNYHGLTEKMESYQSNNLLVIAITIDDFKSINDLYGRSFGDEVLKSLASRLKKLPEVLTASRTNSALFFATFRVKNSDIHSVMDRTLKELGVWDMISGTKIAVPLTFGASHSKEPIDPKKLIQQAEKALSRAKAQHNRYSIYYKSTNNQLPRHKLREILQLAIELNYLPVHFQPIYNLEDGSLKAMELLIRIQSKEHGILMPGQFLEQAQAYGLLTPLTKICVDMIAKNFDKLPSVTININLPPYMLDNTKILDDFLNRFKEQNLPPHRFCIEVLEDEDISAEQLLKSIQRLKKLGFTIAMDDFGTGYSSLARLSILPFDTIKVDRSLLVAASAGNKTILESAITLIKRLNLTVVVEGVETREQLTLIRLLGADAVQGFLLSKPVDARKAKQLPLNAANIIAEF